MTPGVEDSTVRADRRSARWEAHREARRADLVAAAVAAIDRHGPTASIAQIAAAAGVSKPVLYRYFSDKDDLYRAVGHWGAHEVLGALLPMLRAGDSVPETVDACSAAYFRIIDDHPQVFFLLVEHRTSDDPLADGKELIAAAVARATSRLFAALGADPAGAEPWAHGVVGLALAQGEWWLRRRSTDRATAAAHLATFIRYAIEGVAREHGVDLATLRRPAEPGH